MKEREKKKFHPVLKKSGILKEKWRKKSRTQQEISIVVLLVFF